MQSVQYTPQQISNGLDLLVHKIAKIGLSAEIISPFFREKKINGERFVINRETMPLVIILQDAIKYHYGQLGRCYFDGQGKENNTASISVLVDQIFNSNSDGTQRKINYETEFNNINEKLRKAEKYKNKLRKYCNKHFAHTDIKSLRAVEKDYVDLSIPWDEFVGLINDAKDVLRSLYLVCQKSPCDFSEHAYEEYKNQFWKLINFTEVKIANHTPQSKKDSD